MRNVQLGLFAIPLQCIAIAQVDGQRVMRRGLVQGFHTSTWVVVAVQVVGALCTAVVIKFAGNVSLCRGCASRVIHSSCNRSWRR